MYGRNLSNQNGTTNSWIYIQPPGYAGQWVTPTSVNPYQVSFTVPSLANGTYQVWVHNGHGGHYGWSGPLTLTVYSGHRVDEHPVQRQELRRHRQRRHRRHGRHRNRHVGGERLSVLDRLLPGGHL